MTRYPAELSACVLVLAALLACKKSAPTSTTGPQATATSPATTGAGEPAAPEPGQFFMDLDLARVCNELPMKGTKAYDGAPGRIHPTIVFSRKNENDKFYRAYDSALDGWKADKAKDYELVACVTARSRTKVKECKFDSEKPAHYLDLEDASYEMVVYEAQTGKELGRKSVDLKVDKECPMLWMFQSEREVKQADFTQALMGWAKQWVAPKAGAGEQGADKTPEPGAAPAAKAAPKAPAKADPKAAAKTPDPKAPVKADPKASAKAPDPKAPAKPPPGKTSAQIAK